jgi:hypothetical protein
MNLTIGGLSITTIIDVICRIPSYDVESEISNSLIETVPLSYQFDFSYDLPVITLDCEF